MKCIKQIQIPSHKNISLIGLNFIWNFYLSILGLSKGPILLSLQWSINVPLKMNAIEIIFIKNIATMSDG